MSVDSFEALIEDMVLERTCYVCQRAFMDVTSIGRHECRRHTSILVGAGYGHELDTYVCCGVSPHAEHPSYVSYDASLGCVPCDHSIDARLPEHITMPYERARIIFSDDIDERHVRMSDDRRTVTILRSDVEQRAK
jgi:hypothetical protein